MSPTIFIALLGWPVVVLALFTLCTPRRAATIALIAGWLFLPDSVGIRMPGLTDISKLNVISISIVIWAMVFDGGSFIRLRFHWIDIFAVIWCLTPLGSSLDNGLGLYDGIQGAVLNVLVWGLPFFIGRLYYSDLEGMTELARGLVVGGIVYIPLCLIEARMSPQLNYWVYNYRNYNLSAGAYRLGGWRPAVFMSFGLELGLWMACVSTVAVWLWFNGMRTILGMPMSLVVAAQLITTVLCRSLGSLVLMAAAMAAMLLARWLRLGVLVIAFFAIPVIYPLARCADFFSGEVIVNIANTVSEDRGGSMAFRLRNEDLLIEKALQQPVFGWGRWGRNRVYDDTGRDITITDGLWIIYLGQTGWVGLTSFTIMMLAPGVVVAFKLRPYNFWSQPALAPVAALLVVPAIYMIDSLPNGFANPVYTCIAGGLAGWVNPVFAYAAAPTPAPAGPPAPLAAATG